MSKFPSRKRSALLLALGLAATGVAFSALANPNGNDRTVATETLAEFEARASRVVEKPSASASSSASADASSSASASASANASASALASASANTAASHALTQVRRALERADQAKAAGDLVTARHLEGLAREWADMARDAVRASEAESRADQNQLAAARAEASVRKTQATLETLAGRRSRAQGELLQVRSASSAPISSAALSAAMLRPPPATSGTSTGTSGVTPAPKGSK